jgi:cell division protein FtsZ
MRNGGVAILGSAACEGDNRAQKAIEQALNSPLLNDNDIRGAKWILININSAEGENEFTMDEVETIQNHLLSQAGEDTDVILGLGYDNNLENKIGITLIATGFEHKNPFDKKAAPKEALPVEEKIVMALSQPEEKKNLYQQPVFQFDEKKEAKTEDVKAEKKTEFNAEKKIEIKSEQKAELKAEVKVEELKAADNMVPTMMEVPPAQPVVEIPATISNTTVDKSEPEIIHFELSSTFDTQTPTETPPTVITAELPKQENKKSTNNEAVKVTTPTSGGYLAKPSNLYVEEPQQPKQESKKTVEEPLPMQMSAQVDEPAIEMQLVVKDSLEATEEPEQNVQQAQPIMMSNVEEQALPDETDELKRKAMDRIAKLRNLSFNINAADPNNEFESVPAYLRRNMELHNSIADVESFYSNYTVKSNQNNQAEISTINSFLEGKKPD